jgi:hypothetical protein
LSKTQEGNDNEKSKIDIKLKGKQHPSVTLSVHFSFFQRHRVVTSAETGLHAGFSGSASLL